MFSNEIIDDIKKMLSRMKSMEISETTEYYKAQKYIINLIKVSHKFHVYDFSGAFEKINPDKRECQLFRTGFKLGKDKYIKLPYPILYLDGVYEDDHKISLLVEEGKDNSVLRIHCFKYHKDYKMWVVLPFCIYVFIGDCTIIPSLKNNIQNMFDSVNTDIMEELYFNILYSPYDYANDKLRDSFNIWRRNMLEYFAALHTFLVMINCKNISECKIPTSLHINKKRKNSGKLPIYDYHILKIDMNQKKSNNSNNKDRDHTDHCRQHFCRGHVRYYTEENPLFGKYVGPVWIPSHIRGESEGFVHKDYVL